MNFLLAIGIFIAGQATGFLLVLFGAAIGKANRERSLSEVRANGQKERVNNNVSKIRN